MGFGAEAKENAVLINHWVPLYEQSGIEEQHSANSFVGPHNAQTSAAAQCDHTRNYNYW